MERVAVPVSVITASATDTTSATPCVAITSLRESTRSATTPAASPKTVNGTNRQKTRAPTASGDPESSSTSQASATFCIHEPARETSCPAKKIR